MEELGLNNMVQWWLLALGVVNGMGLLWFALRMVGSAAPAAAEQSRAELLAAFEKGHLAECVAVCCWQCCQPLLPPDLRSSRCRSACCLGFLQMGAVAELELDPQPLESTRYECPWPSPDRLFSLPVAP